MQSILVLIGTSLHLQAIREDGLSGLIKDLVGSWNVAFKQYRWAYTFTASVGLTWRDIWNGRAGTGSWMNNGAKIVITSRNSETKETWNIPIDPDNQSGDIEADYASGKFTATKDQTPFEAVSPEGQLDAFGPLGGHVNVIHHLDESSGTVMAMEPWFPDPMTNPHFKFEGGVFVNKSNGDPFKFHGKHINRPMSFYTSKLLGGQFIVGFNSKFNISSR